VRYASAIVLALLTVFCAAARGAYDQWASLVLVFGILALLSGVLLFAARTGEDVPAFPWVSAALASVGVALSLWNPVNPHESRAVFPAWAAAFLAFPLAVRAFEEEEAFGEFLRLLVPFFWIQGALVLKEQVTSTPLFFHQSAGLLFDANASAAFHAAWIPPLIDRVLRDKRKTGRLPAYWTVGLIAAFAGFAGAKSVWGWVALAAALPWFFPGRFGRREAVIAGIAVLAAGAWKFTSSSDRIGWWLTGLRMFAEHPATGVGVGGFSTAFLPFRVGAGVHTVSPHGAPIQILAEIGLIGAGLLAWAVSIGVRSAGLAALKARRGPALGVLALAVFSLVSVCFEFPVNLLSLSLLAGAAAAGASPRRIPVRQAPALAVLAAALCASPFLVSPWQAGRQCRAGIDAIAAGDIDGAAALFESAGALDARSYEAPRGLARVAAHRGDMGGAVDFQREAVSRNSFNAVLWAELGLYLKAAGRLEEAAGAGERAAVLSAGLLKKGP
jgi:O-antigen ligase